MKKTLLGLLLAGIMVVPLMARATTPVQLTNEDLQAMIQKLQAQILALQAQQAQLAQNQKPFCYNWQKNLKIEDKGVAVYNLHIALQGEGFRVAGEEMVGDPAYSNESNFGESTAAAVVGFQEKYKNEVLTPAGLDRGTGYVGRLTRAKLNKLYDCNLIVTNQPGAPVISGVGGPTQLKAGITGTWNITAKDPEGGSLKYSVIWGDETYTPVAPSQDVVPYYAPLQTSTFTHVYNRDGKFTPTFTVTDESGLSAKTSISVIVGNGALPEESFEWLPPATIGKFYDQELSTARLTLKSGSLPKGFSLIYSALPCPLSLNNTISACVYEPVTRLQGTPTEFEKTTFALTDGTRVKEYGFYVAGSRPAPLPSAAIALPDAQVNVLYNQAVKIGDVYSALKLVSGALPDGMYLINTSNPCTVIQPLPNGPPMNCDAVASEPRIQGTPSQSGTFAFTLTNGTTKQNFTIAVYGADYQPPQNTSVEMPSATVGVYYSQQIKKFGDIHANLSLKSGALPDGLSLANQSVICATSYGQTDSGCPNLAATTLQGTPTRFGRFTFELTDGSKFQKYSLLVNN